MTRNLARVMLSLFLTLSILAAPIPALAANWIPVYVDTEQVTFDEQPFSVDSRLLVGLRAVFEAFGSEVHWNGDLQKITSSNGDVPLEFVVDSKTYWINGVAYQADVAPKAVNGRIFVPLRLIAECYDANVYWNDEVDSVIIFSKDYQPKTTNPQEGEPNDSFRSAYKMYPGQIVSGKFNSQTDVDVFALWINVEGSYIVKAERGNPSQEPAFEVFNALETRLATSTADADGIHTCHADFKPGKYYIRVNNLKDQVLDDAYKLSVTPSR